jgi:hypothetical protein
MITTTAFRTLAENERIAKGVPDLPLLVIEHPLGGETLDGVAERAEQAARAIADALRRIPVRV